MLVDIHKFGDASTKFYRTSQLIQAKHDPLTQSFDVWADWLSDAFTQFRADFESLDPTHKDHFHCGEFHSFLLLHGTDRTQFRPVYEEQLRATPTGRFPDTSALIKLFRDYHRSQVMSVDCVSNQGSSFLSASTHVTGEQPLSYSASTASKPSWTAPNVTNNPKKSKQPNATPKPPGCPHCKASGDRIPRRGHDPNFCSHKPPSSANAAAVANPSADSDRLDRIESTLTSLAAIMSPMISELEEDA